MFILQRTREEDVCQIDCPYHLSQSALSHLLPMDPRSQIPHSLRYAACMGRNESHVGNNTDEGEQDGDSN
jgi:hypothetical protein